MKLIATVLVLAIGCHGPTGSQATQAADKTDVARIQENIGKLQMRVDGARARVGVLETEMFGTHMTKTSPTESEPEFAWWCGITHCTRYEQQCITLDRTCAKRRVAWCPIGKPAPGIPHCYADVGACKIEETSDGISSCLGVE